MKTRILVFPCGTEIGTEINYALQRSIHVELFGASSISSNHGKYIYKNYIEGVPYVENPKFIGEINAIVKANKIDLIYPAHDDALLKLSENSDKIHCGIIGSLLRTCQICRSKKKTYETFEGKLKLPRLYDISQKTLPFPLFVKPDISEGSRGAFYVPSKEDAVFYLRKEPSSLLMEYLPGTEYTVDCFTDRHGALRFVGPRERRRIRNGISVDTIPVKDENRRFSSIADIITKTIRMRGAWFFQVKEKSNGELALLEIAPRIAGSMALYRNLGVNFALLNIFDAMNIDVKIVMNDFNLTMDRTLCNRYKTDLVYDSVYIDLDDCLIVDKKINPLMIAFLYQCLNKKKKLHLLSRHKHNMDKTLSAFRIDHLFDSVKQLKAGENKSNHIKGKRSIFIDDSFAERFEVKSKTGIPVFDTSSIECLLDWRV
jgi:hypothetical protein